MDTSNPINADTLIELGFLLKRSRTEENKNKVVEILNMKIPITEKKKLIEKLDNASREQMIKDRFSSWLSGNIDQKIRMHINSIEKEISVRVGEIKKDLTRTNILLVDDLPYITKTVSYILEKENFKVLSAKNAAEGLLLFQSMIPDLVITDIHLPDFNGFELAMLIRKLDEMVPVIFITAIDIDEELEHYDLKKKRMAYLQKPITKEQLLETINKLINEI